MNHIGMRQPLRRQRHRLMAGAAFVTLIAAASATQATADDAPSSTSAQNAQQVSEVVVTAQKRSERLLSVAAPVTALSSADLTRSAAVKLDDYAAKVPGLNLISDRTGETQIVLRGVTTGSPVSSTVATYVDDTPYGSSTSAALGGWLQPDLDPSDIQRVEVLRGPQGTLYGASALGGLIKYVTKQPDLANTAGRIEFDGSSVDHGGQGYGVRGMLNVPLVTDTLAVRVSAYDRRDPGYIDNRQLGLSDVNATEVEGGRVSLLWKPTASLSVNLTAVLQDLKSDGSSDEDVNVTGGSITPVAGSQKQIRYATEPLNVNHRVYSATINDDLGWANLASITSYSTLHQTAIVDETQTFGPIVTTITGIPNFGTSTGSVLDQDKWTQELRLSSPTGQRLEWLGGFFFTRETSNRDEPTFNFDTITGIPPLPDNALFFANLQSRYTEYAAYGDVTYHFTPQFDVQAGLRYSVNNQTFALAESGIFVGGVQRPGRGLLRPQLHLSGDAAVQDRRQHHDLCPDRLRLPPGRPERADALRLGRRRARRLQAGHAHRLRGGLQGLPGPAQADPGPVGLLHRLAGHPDRDRLQRHHQQRQWRHGHQRRDRGQRRADADPRPDPVRQRRLHGRPPDGGRAGGERPQRRRAAQRAQMVRQSERRLRLRGRRRIPAALSAGPCATWATGPRASSPAHRSASIVRSCRPTPPWTCGPASPTTAFRWSSM